MRCILLFALVLLGTSSRVLAESPASPIYLRCEYKVDPLGIGVDKPRLFWEMQDSRRGAKQTGYHILVASSPEKLAAHQGDLWDTGRVASSQTAHIVYTGKPLASRMQCYWKVRLWDHAGKPSPWSKPALWSMGLLKKEDFQPQTKWIGYEPSSDVSAPTINLDGCQWVWFPEGDPRTAAPPGRRYFRGKVNVPKNKNIKEGQFVFLVDDNADVIFNGRYIATVHGVANARCIDVADFVEPGDNCIAICATNGGDAPNPAALAGKLVITFDDGQTMTARIDKTWKASDFDFKDNDVRAWLQFDTRGWRKWLQPSFDDSSWPVAKELAPVVEKPVVYTIPPRGCPLLRKEFQIDQPIRRATIYVSALGAYRMYVNGRAVGKDYLTPGWTDYHQRVYYNTYDVTDLVKQGPNAVGGILGPGWYAGPVSTIEGGAVYGPNPRLIAQLEIELADGSRKTIGTDASWKAAAGPYIQGENYAGEIYDATREIPGWDRPGLNTTKGDSPIFAGQKSGQSPWRPVHTGENNPNILDAFPGAPVQETGNVKPVKMTEPQPGRFVFDLGQNFAGVARLKVKGPRGTRVEIRCAERLKPDGTIYTANLRQARCRDIYTLRGDGEEIYQPIFPFRSFQYVELRNFPGKPDLETVTGVVLSAANPPVGEFECSNPMLNRLFSNIVWTQRANYLSIPTDCPNREERLGWMGDAQVFIRTATYNADVAAFFTKWLVDVNDAQFPDGAFSDVSPRYWDRECGHAGWGDAGVICPSTIYWAYNDRRLLEQHYPAMTRWIEYCRKNSDHLLRPNSGWGDWLCTGQETPLDVMATAYFAESTKLTAQAAKALGREEDAKKYFTLFEKIKAAFNKAYVSNDGRIKGNTQTAYALALDFEILPPEKRALAVKHLGEDIKKHDGTLTSGIVGTGRVISVLSRFGQTPLAYQLLQSEKYPSWGFSIKQGATSLWERWNGWTPDDGFANPMMNSFSHPALGSVGQSLFQMMAGIDAAEPGFQKIVIHPEPGEGVDWVKAGYRSMNGKVVSAWKKGRGTLTLDVTIPPNTTAIVQLPTNVDQANAPIDAITESGKPLGKVPDIKILGQGDQGTIVEVDAGLYHFKMPWK
jgi:alpha-L-rhamnosidase